MRKTIYYIIAILLFSLLIFQSGTDTAIAHDDDDDGVDDDFEGLNERNIIVKEEDGGYEIETILKAGSSIDEIEYYLLNNSNGFSIKTEYERETGSEEIEVGFNITFISIIEYNDTDQNNRYNDSDDIVRELTLDNFQPTNYSVENLTTSENDLYHFIVNTTDGNFTAHIYIAEEFTLINNSVVTPTQIKIDIEINNFTYYSINSRLALNTTFESEVEYEEEDDTEDEIMGYSENEDWLITTMNATSGFFSWNNTADVDGIEKEVLISNRTLVGDDERIYINYPNGTHIYHDPKIGIAGILNSVVIAPSSGKSDKSKAGIPTIPIFLTPIYILAAVLIIGASVAASSIYYYKKKHLTGHYDNKIGLKPSILTMRDKFSGDILADSGFKGELLQIFEEENALDKISKLGEINITVISEDFLETINTFDWEYDEKEEFVKELLALTPKERKEILDEMKERTFRNSSHV